MPLRAYICIYTRVLVMPAATAAGADGDDDDDPLANWGMQLYFFSSRARACAGMLLGSVCGKKVVSR